MTDWRPSLIPAVIYRDPRAAMAWLEEAFGFEPIMLIENQDGALEHCELRHGNAALMVGSEWSANHASPASLQGRNTQNVHIGIEGDLDAHCERARQAGAEIINEPETQFYGDRTYRCRDPEGHIWTVSRTVAEVTREEAEQASGLKITGWI